MSDRLGVPWMSLVNAGMVKAEREQMAFPMFDWRRHLVGVRIRGYDGKKWALPGSRNGLFIPMNRKPEGWLFACEGPTDLAALLSLGLDGFGRPSCTGGVEESVRLVGVRPLVIVADGDGPGRDGAERLATAMRKASRDKVIRIIEPMGRKDMREWLKDGATRSIVEAVVKNTRDWTG